MNKSEERILKNKKLKKRRQKIKKIFFVLLIFLALLFILKKSGLLNIKKIVVKGPEGIPSKEIIKESGYAKGENYFLTSKKQKIKSIEDIPNVKNVKTSFALNGVVTISADIREPKAQIPGKDKYFIVDDEFKVISVNKKEKANLMTVEGLKTEKYALGNYIFSKENDQQELLKRLFEDEVFKGNVDTVILKNNYSRFYTNDDIKIDLGTYMDLDYKFKMLDLIVKDIEKTGKNVSSIEMEKGPNPIVIERSSSEVEKINKNSIKNNENNE